MTVDQDDRPTELEIRRLKILKNVFVALACLLLLAVWIWY